MNIFEKICKYFVDNRKLSLLIFFGIIFWGILSFVITPKQYNPEITAPAFNVVVEFPGATSREVYELITKPLEDVIQSIEGIDEIYSQSIHGGRSIVTVQFDVGYDFDRSKIRLRQRLSSNMNLKPLGVKEISIEAIDPDDLAVMTLGFFSDKFTPVQLRKKALEFKNIVKLVPGVSIVDVVGGEKREYKIVLKPKKLAETKTSVSEIESALNKSSLLSILGKIKSPIKFYSVETTGKVANLEDIENIVIASNINHTLKIKDVAKVKEGVVEDDVYVNFYDKNKFVENVVLLSIAKKKGQNISKVTRAINAKIAQIKQDTSFLNDIKIGILRDEGRVAKEEIQGLTINLIQAILIVFVILFAFLNARAAVMVAITVPLTLLTVFGIGHLYGYTINRITLFALILSLGLLVDSATVVVENIVRNKREHPDWLNGRVIISSVGEVGMGLFLSTLTTVLAFIPMKFVTGMMGPYIGPLPFFVSTAIIVSLIYSYTIVPWMASIFCKKTVLVDSTSRAKKIYDNLVARYAKFIDAILSSKVKRKRLILISLLLVGIVFCFPVLKLLKFRMLPKADREQIYVYLDLDLGTSIDKTYGISAEIAKSLANLPETKSVQVFVGTPQILDFNGMFKGAASRSGTNQATLKLNLTHPANRDEASEDIAYEYRKKIDNLLSKYSEARYQVIEDPPGPPVRSTFFVKVKSNDPKLMQQVAKELEIEADAVDQVFDLDTTIPENLSKYTLKVDTEKAVRAGVSTSSIAKALEVLYKGAIIGIYHDNDNLEQETITLSFDRKYRDEIADLEEITVVNKVGNPIPVKNFLIIEHKNNSNTILSDNREEVIYISGEMGRRSITYAAIDYLFNLYSYLPTIDGAKRTDFSILSVKYDLPGDKWIKVELDGEWKMTLEVFRDLGLAMAVAMVLIYIVLVAKFHSYLIPLLISATIPLALVGVFPGFAFLFLANRVYFSATSMIGVIALAGIVVNNAIILLEYIMFRLEANEDLKQAIIGACQVRLRPIILTSLTTIMGSLAIAGDPVWSGLAWSIVFGLSLSAVLTLIVFPTLVYHFFEHRQLLPKPVAC